jgi:predicted enzyme related to lactoylglutathione lyase
VAEHPIVHIEFSAKDLEATGRFYSELFGWKIQPVQEFNYALFEAPPGPGGGFPKVDDELIKAGDVLVYIGTDDIDATLAKVESLGGKILVRKMEIPNIGWWAAFADPTGNRVGLFTGMGGQA